MRVRFACALAVMTTLLVSGATAAQSPAKKPVAAPTKAAEKSPGAGPIVVVETEKGSFEFETYPNEAPQTVKHILGLISRRFYNGQRFHRVIPNFVIQMGDPQTRDMTKQDTWGNGSSGKPIGAAEFSKLRTHTRGAVAMAYAGADARAADSQFYVTLANHHELDGRFVVFGKVLSGMDVVDKIRVPDRIIRVTVKEAS